jgi:hypothetical protein
MFLHQLDLTTALRPSLLPEETLLFVQDAVGLYEGYELDLHTTAVANRYRPASSRYHSTSMDRRI